MPLVKHYTVKTAKYQSMRRYSQQSINLTYLFKADFWPNKFVDASTVLLLGVSLLIHVTHQDKDICWIDYSE